MAEPESKGSGFASAVATLKKMLTPEELARVLAVLSPETARLVEHPPLAVSWIPSKHFQELSQAADAQVFAGDESKLEDWGRLALLNDLKTIYKMFIRFMSPQFVIDRGAKLWDTYTRHQGTVRAVAAGERTAEVYYMGMPASLVSPAFWAYQRGALRGAMEATGMKNITVDTLGGGGSNGNARFRVTWS